ncbi:hypothetical protein [Acetobacterium bakii]|uniref:hypothetical protein n=1 Tax=Acetobacterium bakii TaxID=52689 RepID=UPI0006808DCB|nr:hypothetical protein [Acetobacterium bakii]
MNIKPMDNNTIITQKAQTKGSSQTNDVSENTKGTENLKDQQTRVDTLELGNSQKEDTGTYTIDRKKLNEIKQDFTKNTESFKKMVRLMLEKQGSKTNEILKNLSEGKEATITVDSETQAAAQEAVSDQGYWGVTSTAGRIIDFAKTISGGDKSKIDLLRSAFKEGFEKAKEAFGGELPEISQLTYDKVMEDFEAWEKE